MRCDLCRRNYTLITVSCSRQATIRRQTSMDELRSASFLESSAKRLSRATMSCRFARVGLENSQASEAAQPRGLVVNRQWHGLSASLFCGAGNWLSTWSWSSRPPSLHSSKSDLLWHVDCKPIGGIEDFIQCQEKSKSPKKQLLITSWHE